MSSMSSVSSVRIEIRTQGLNPLRFAVVGMIIGVQGLFEEPQGLAKRNAVQHMYFTCEKVKKKV